MLTTIAPVELATGLRPVLLQLNRHLRRELAPLEITAGQAALLHQIRTNPGIGVRELSRREGISAPAMSGYIDRLQLAGMVARVRSSEDRRRVGLTVTEAGTRALRSARSRRTAWLARRLTRLTDDQRAAIAAALEPLALLLAEEPA